MPELSPLDKVSILRVRETIENMFNSLVVEDKLSEDDSPTYYITEIPYTEAQVTSFVTGVLNMYVGKKAITKFEIEDIFVSPKSIKIHVVVYFVRLTQPIEIEWRFSR